MIRVSLDSGRRRYRLMVVVFFVQVMAVIVCQQRSAAYEVAYIDPGSGLFALQILVSSVLGALYLAVGKLRTLFESTLKHRGTEQAVSSVEKCADERL